MLEDSHFRFFLRIAGLGGQLKLSEIGQVYSAINAGAAFHQNNILFLKLIDFKMS